MLRCRIKIILIIFLFINISRVYAVEQRSFSFYMQEGQKAFLAKNYNLANQYFQEALALNPSSRDPIYYINFIKRLQEDRVEELNYSTPVNFPIKRQSSKIIQKAPAVEKNKIIQHPRSVASLQKNISNNTSTSISRSMASPTNSLSNIKNKASERPTIIATSTSLNKEPKIIYLDDQLKVDQSKVFLQVELGSTVIFEGKNIERFLVITPGFIDVDRVDRNRIKILAGKRGLTYLHVWDDQGRWTFNVEVIYQIQKNRLVEAKNTLEQEANPFRLTYSADWGAFYRGPNMTKQERQTLSFLQFSSLYGETPFGDYDHYIIVNKYIDSHEITGYSVGLTHGQLGSFHDFTIRGFDNNKAFSPLTVPGQYFRGILVESEAFHNNFKYTYFHGKDRAVYGFLAPNFLEGRESFVEGVKMTIHPRSENQYSLNFARGYGAIREPFLKDRVVSLQVQRRIKKVLVSAEQAYDDDTLARTIHTKYDKDDFHLHISARDIDKDFATITSLPSNRGEVGGTIGLDKKFGVLDWTNSFDIYRDRLLPNEENPSAINLDLSTSFDFNLSDRDNFRTSVYWLDTPGEFSARRNLRIYNLYSKRFPFWNNRDINSFVGTTYQRSRFASNDSSEYDRYSLIAGFSLPLFLKGLNYFANYEYSWLTELSTNDHLNPSVFNTGLNYIKNLTEHWTTTIGFTYRDEERTDGINSFLAGEDSTIGSLGFTYRPVNDFEFFFDGRVRNVWAENSRSSAFNEIDVRSGVRSSWDTPFRFNPSAKVAGVVYKDINNNKKRDGNEEGIANVIVKVGQKSVRTDAYGKYLTKVNAKKVQVALDISSLPQGFIFSTPAIVSVDVKNLSTNTVDFGLTTNSGIYGVVYIDRNGNQKPDKEDQRISQAKITLDNKTKATTDSDGNYFFQDIAPGKHILTIDVNSLPENLLPVGRIRNEVDVVEGTTYVFHVPLKEASGQ